MPSNRIWPLRKCSLKNNKQKVANIFVYKPYIIFLVFGRVERKLGCEFLNMGPTFPHAPA